MQENINFETYYGSVNKNILKIAKCIRLLICDVDGVMSNGLIYMGNQGEELKTFNTRDGYGIQCLLTSDIHVAIITGSSYSKSLEYRCAKLGIKHVYQCQLDKTISFKLLLDELKLTANQASYIGDDLNDIIIMNQVGLSVAVADAHPILKSKADYVTHMFGGQGAIREICDLILLAQKKYKN